MTEWIEVVGWETFQHYHDRRPTWIKDYPDQLDRDEYLELTPTARALLQDLRRLYALSGGVVRMDAVATRVRMRVTMSHFQSLSDAGFIRILASKPLALTHARALAREETETDTPLPPQVGDSLRAKGTNPRAKAKRDLPRRKAEAWIDNGLADMVPPEHLTEVIGDEFGITEPALLDALTQRAIQRKEATAPW